MILKPSNSHWEYMQTNKREKRCPYTVFHTKCWVTLDFLPQTQVSPSNFASFVIFFPSFQPPRSTAKLSKTIQTSIWKIAYVLLFVRNNIILSTHLSDNEYYMYGEDWSTPKSAHLNLDICLWKPRSCTFFFFFCEVITSGVLEHW